MKGLSLQEWWATTDRADWMLWFMGCGKFEKATYVRIAIGLAESVLHLVRDEDRPVAEAAIQAGKDWLANPTEKNRQKARLAADDAYATARAADDAYAAAAYTADSAAAVRAVAAYAVYAADSAESAAYAAARAAYSADDDPARRRQQADIVRDIVGYDEILKKLTTEETNGKKN